MYLVHLKTMLVNALRLTFDSEFPQSDFRNIYVSIEYPVDSASYPGIWCDYDDEQPLMRAGIDHHEMLDISTPENSLFSPYTRWKFQGSVSMTIVAMTSLERDRLYDEVVRVLAFGNEDGATHQFRQYVENNEFIAANMNFDIIQPRGNVAAPGTPWGTDEIIYERTVNVDILGEFLADKITGSLVPLKRIEMVSTHQSLTEDHQIFSATGFALSDNRHIQDDSLVLHTQAGVLMVAGVDYFVTGPIPDNPKTYITRLPYGLLTPSPHGVREGNLVRVSYSVLQERNQHESLSDDDLIYYDDSNNTSSHDWH